MTNTNTEDPQLTKTIDAAATTLVNEVTNLHLAAAGQHREDIATIRDGIGAMFNAAEQARDAAIAARNNKDIHPDGRAERSNRTLDVTERAITDHALTLDTMAVVLEASLTTAAFRVRDNATAVANVESALKLAKDPGKMLETMASEDESDDVIALLAGEWGRRVGKALGLDPEWQETRRPMALRRLARSTDPLRNRDAGLALSSKKVRAAVNMGRSLAVRSLRRR